MTIKIPRRKQGQRKFGPKEEQYQAELATFVRTLLEFRSRVDFRVSARGWAYILEQARIIDKGDIDAAEDLINNCRKSGDLPLDFCSDDAGRETTCLDNIDDTTPEEEAEEWNDFVRNRAHLAYRPFSFWDDLDVYIETGVEKIDLIGLWKPVSQKFRVPLSNLSGWSDINKRVAMMQRFKRWEAKGKQCILLLGVDLDPGGVQISGTMRSNLEDLAHAVGWSPRKLIIDRFAINKDFIDLHNLTWIDNLETASKKRLDDPKHPDHFKPYVQNYIREYGVRKVEANVLVTRLDAGRELYRQAILKYVPEDAVARYERKLKRARMKMQKHLRRLLSE